MSESEIDLHLVDRIVRRVFPKYRQYVEREDVRQEVCLWWLLHKKFCDGLEPERLEFDLQRVAVRYCRNEKAERTGNPDRFVYTSGLVAGLVRVLVNPTTETVSADLTDVGAMLSDVMGALNRLPEHLRAPVVQQAAGLKYREIAEREGISVATAHRRVQVGLNQIVLLLGGEPEGAVTDE